jgi:hypothetical protein
VKPIGETEAEVADEIMQIRESVAADFAPMLALVNDAATAYRGVIPADRWHEPYMPADQLLSEIAAGRWKPGRQAHTDRHLGHHSVGDRFLPAQRIHAPVEQGQGQFTPEILVDRGGRSKRQSCLHERWIKRSSRRRVDGSSGDY